MSSVSLEISPPISGRTETASSGPMSPAAVTLKLISRVATTAVVGRPGFRVAEANPDFQNVILSGYFCPAQ